MNRIRHHGTWRGERWMSRQAKHAQEDREYKAEKAKTSKHNGERIRESIAQVCGGAA